MVRDAASSVSRFMNCLLSDLLWHGVLFYIDDIIVSAHKWDEHQRLLEEVLRRL